MKLYLVQHGEALSPDINPERPLSPEGNKNVEKLAAFLGRRGFPVSKILHSEKLRARQTADIFARYLEPHLEAEEHKNLAPNDPIEPILDLIEDGLMIVGHLPYLQKLSGYLIAHDQHAVVLKFSEGKVFCLEKIDSRYAVDWAIGTNHIP